MDFRLLGPFQAEHDGRRVDLGRRRERCLLGLLLLEDGRTVPADRLLDLLWDDEPPDTGLRQLRTHISRLRTRLRPYGGDVRIRTYGGGYAVEVDPERVDVHRFRRLVERATGIDDPAARSALLRPALALWQGPLMADVMTDRLRQRVAGRLEESRLSAWEQLAEADLHAGRAGAVAAELAELTARHPLHERLAALTMLAHYRSGDQVAASQAYHRFRRDLAGHLGLDPSADLVRLHERILRQDPALSAPAGGAASYVPAQLPVDVARFTGRVGQLRRLDEIAAGVGRADPASAVVVTAITGAAGVGKTALAVHWAHRVRDRFPDGQLYADLRGFDPSGTVAGPPEVIRRFLDALDVAAERVPADLDAQAALYRTVLAGRRVLVVLDNARDAEQVRPLLPAAPGCLVLITSRNQLAGLVAAEGANPLALDILTPDEAHDLLTDRLGAKRTMAEPDAVDEVVGWCARLPLALAIVAARATVNPDLPLAAIADELGDSHQRLDALTTGDATTDVRAVFSWSNRTLSPDAARLFRLLGLHPGPDISVPAAASLAGLARDTTRHLLAELTRAHLATEHVPGRFALHDLLRAYAGEQAGAHEPPRARDAALDRVFAHYVHTGYVASLALNPQREPITLLPTGAGVVPERPADDRQAMAWFGSEHPVLVAAIRAAAAAGFDAPAWQLAWTLVTWLIRRGPWRDLVETQQTALDAARRSGDLSGQALSHRLLGRAYLRLGRPDDGGVHLGQALDLYRTLGDDAGVATTHLDMSEMHYRQGRNELALRHGEEAHRGFVATGNDAGAASALNAIGWQCILLGDHRRAVTVCGEALALFQAAGNRYGEANTWDSLGYAHHLLGQNVRAVTCFQRAIDLRRDLGDRFEEAETAERLGDAQHALGRADAARASWRHALDLLDELNHAHARAVRAKVDRAVT
jgi:DNA-binding SARP family transcriptional activator/tetratricopeptide (TPR) repeat protein